MFTLRSATPVLFGAIVATSCGGTSLVSDNKSEYVALIPTSPSTPRPAPPAPAPASTKSICEEIGYGKPRAGCTPGTPRLLGQMSAAIDRLIANRPDLFEPGAVAPWGDPRVVNQELYYEALLGELESAGICAARKEDSMVVNVKTTNDWSEEYQPITSQRYPWRGKNSYVAQCSPASFPGAPIDHIDYLFVTAYGLACNPFEDFALGARGPKPVIPMTCVAHVTATPKTWDQVDVPLEVHGPDILWEVEEGKVTVEQWSWQPFNLTVYPQAPGPVKICATVKEFRGCVSGQVVAKPASK